MLKLGSVPKRAPRTGKTFPKLRNGAIHGDLFLLAAMTGARKSELLCLKKADVDLERRSVVFRDTKNRKNHELPLTTNMVKILRKRIEESSTHLYSLRQMIMQYHLTLEAAAEFSAKLVYPLLSMI